MSLSTFVGSFTVPAATGNKAVTGVGFRPLAVIFYGNGRTADGVSANATTNTDEATYYGFGVSSSSRVVITDDGIFSAGGPTSTDTTKCISYAQGGSLKFAADMVSLDADGFTVNFTTAFATASLVNFMALGGTDLTNVAIKSVASPAGTGNQASTGVGFKPDAMMLLGQDPVFSGHNALSMGIGFAVSATQRGANCYFMDTASPFGETTYQRITKCFVATSDAAVLREADLVSLDSDGFTLNWTTAATGQTIYALCLKGGQYHVGSLAQKTSTGAQATTGVGFQPTGLLLTHVGAAATTSVGVLGAYKGLGAASSAAARSVMWTGNGNDGVGELDRAAIYTSRADDSTPTLQGKADLTSFDADGFTLNYGTADATAREILYLAFGNAAGGPSNAQIAPAVLQQRIDGVMGRVDA